MTKLYTNHDLALVTYLAQIEQDAESLGMVLIGAPGVLEVEQKPSGAYYRRRYIDASGKRVSQAIGAAEDPQCGQRAQSTREQIEATKGMIERIRNLAKMGFQLCDNKTYSVLAVLHNHGVFEAGAVLIGSNAYAVLLNALGVRAISFQTNDVDVARGEKITLVDDAEFDLQAALQSTGVPFVPVPPLGRGNPSTSFKEIGRSQFRVDLLAPSKDRDVGIVPVPEFNAHAQTLPYLSYLLGETLVATAISRHGAVPVRVPDPARFALHKMISSQSRTNMQAKVEKDLKQAATIIAALTELRPGEIERAAHALPDSSRVLVRAAMDQIDHLLGDHKTGMDELEDGMRPKSAHRPAP